MRSYRKRTTILHSLFGAMLIATWLSDPQRALAVPPGPPPRNADFNKDGYDDIAVGAPAEDTDDVDAGAVYLVYGSANGPSTPAYTLRFTQDTPSVEGGVEEDDWFGYALAWGDFNADGYDDLAIGAPNEDISTAACTSNNGAVHVIYGGSGGLSPTNTPVDTLWHADTSGITAIDPDCEDYFGWNLAAGLFDDDEYDDLAIGIEGDDVGGTSNAGSVLILYGSSSGITATGNDFFHQGTAGIAGDGNQAGDAFGTVLASGDFDCDGLDDLAIGAPEEDLTGANDAGGVTVLYGSSGGLSTSGSAWFTQDTSGVAGAPELGDRFGWALAAGNFNADNNATINCMDLAIGAPIEGVTPEAGGSEQSGAGAVTLLLSAGGGGLSGSSSQLLYADVGDLPGTTEAGANFGDALTVGRLNDDGFDDLIIGSGDATCGGTQYAGQVFLLQGTTFGVTTVDSLAWSQSTNGIADSCETTDNWGGGIWSTNTFAWFRGEDQDRYLVVGNYAEDALGDVTHLRLQDGQTDPTLVSSLQWYADDIDATGTSPENFGVISTQPRNVWRPD